MVEELRGGLDSLVDKLSRLPASRLAAGTQGGRGPAREGHELAQLLADAAAGVEEREAPIPPPSRQVPWLGPFAVADQLAVIGSDLWAAAVGLDTGTAVWSGTTRRDLGGVLEDCTRALAALYGRI